MVITQLTTELYSCKQSVQRGKNLISERNVKFKETNEKITFEVNFANTHENMACSISCMK